MSGHVLLRSQRCQPARGYTTRRWSLKPIATLTRMSHSRWLSSLPVKTDLSQHSNLLDQLRADNAGFKCGTNCLFSSALMGSSSGIAPSESSSPGTGWRARESLDSASLRPQSLAPLLRPRAHSSRSDDCREQSTDVTSEHLCRRGQRVRGQYRLLGRSIACANPI